MLRFLRTLIDRDGGAADVGARAERAAADWLRRERGFVTLVQNWRNPHDEREELDLVCRDGDVVVFVEVKARSSSALVPGYYAIDRRKKRALQSVARAYLARLRPTPLTFRFDVVEVTLRRPAVSPKGLATSPSSSAPEFEIRHFENVPLFSKAFRG